MFHKKLLSGTASVAVLMACSFGANAKDISNIDLTKLFPEGFTAGFSVSEQYNDNIFSTRNDRQSDFITIYEPSLEYAYDGEKFDFTIGGEAAIGRYADTPTEDYEDYRVYADGQAQLSPNVKFISGLAHAHQHESRTSPDDVLGTNPTVFELTGGYAGLQVRSGDNALKIGTTVDYLNYQDSGAVNNDDRDRNLVGAGMRLDHWTNKSTRLFAETTWDGRYYRLATDDNGFDRDSDGFSASAGVFHRFTPNLYGTLYTGWIYRNYKDDRLENVSVPDFGGRLNWRTANGGTVNVVAQRSIDETTLAGASAYVRSALAASYYQNLNDRIRVGARMSYSHNDYLGTAQTDHVYRASVDGRYYMNPHAYLGLDYTYENRDSTIVANDFDQSTIMFRLGADLSPAYDSDVAAGLTPASGWPHSFYIGGKTGLANTGTALSGPRESDGTLQADFADFGAGGTLFAGLGTTVNKWYLGLEADVSFSGAQWDHARLPGGRVFSVEQGVSGGLSAIFGPTLKSGGMVFGRAGIKLADFDTSYQTASGSQFPQSNTELGFRMGAGLQTNISPSIALRMEYEHTIYGDYNVTVPSGTDNFANTESLMSVGIAYRFGAGGSGAGSVAATTLDVSDFGGFYAGFQAGHGTIVTTASGPRKAGSVLTADFGDSTITGGLVAGYSVQHGRVIVSGEADASLSTAGWNHTRVSSGRTYSVDKVYSLGLSARAGTIVGDATFLYARAGVIYSQFNNKFVRGSVNIDQNELKAGWRVGVGMEMPVTDTMSVRADLSYMDYGDMTLYVPGDTNGTESYSTKESLFTLGTVFRF